MRLLNYLRRSDVQVDPARLLARRVWFEAERRLFGPERKRTCRFDRDLRIRLSPSDSVSRGIYLYGYYEFRTSQLFCSLLKPGMTAMDAGAHIGHYTLLAAKRVGADGKVLAVEPNPDNAAQLRRNVQLNRFSNVVVLTVALSDHEGAQPLYLRTGPESGPRGSLRPHGADDRAIEVPLKTVDALGLQALDVMKVDVEGYDRQVLVGARNTIQRFRPAILFEPFYDEAQYEADLRTTETIDLLRDWGYGLYGIGSDGQLVSVLPGMKLVMFKESWYSLNLLALPPTWPGRRDD